MTLLSTLGTYALWCLAIIATIAFGVFGPWFGQFAWIRNAFETGASLLRQLARGGI